MENSSGKTLLLFVLVVAVLLVVVRVNPFLMAPLAGLLSAVKGIGVGHWGSFGPGRMIMPMFSVFMLIMWLTVIVWVYKDAEKRSMNGVLWALLVLIGSVIGLLIYLIVRSDPGGASTLGIRPVTCPACHMKTSSGFAFCPHCGSKLESGCPQCGKPVEPGWQNCPHCGVPLEK